MSRGPRRGTMPSGVPGAGMRVIETTARRVARLRALTRMPGSWDKLLMSVSLMPSLKYSVSGLPVALKKGRTAIDPI